MVYYTFFFANEFLLTLVFHFYSFCFLASIFSSNCATVKMASRKSFLLKDAEICEEIYLWISYDSEIV